MLFINHYVQICIQQLRTVNRRLALNIFNSIIRQINLGAVVVIQRVLINKALQIMGYDTLKTHCAHGFRPTARTILDEVLGFRVEWIEHQLAHAVRDALGRAYNRTTHLPQRKEMMQKWADYLDLLRLQALSPNVITANFGQAS